MSNVRPHVAEKSASYEVLKKLERSAPWPRVPLTEAVDLNPKPERSSLSDELEVSFVPMAAVEAGTGAIDTSTVRRYGEVKKGYTYFRDGDVLFAKITPCMENGKMAVARQLRNGIGFGSTEFHVLRPRMGVDAHYVYHFVSSARFRAEAAHRMTGAVGQKRVPAAFLEQSEIPLPPIDEQRRLVAEMEKQFSRLDEAVANLNRVTANLGRYKSAVLGAAVRGELTGLRRRDRHSLETLPHGWRWATVQEVASSEARSIQSGPFGSNLKHSEFQTFGKLVIGIDNVQDGRFSIGAEHRIRDAKFRELQKYAARPGDVLITVMATIGRTCVVPDELEPAIITKHVYRIAVNRDIVLPHYLCIALRGGETVRAQLLGSVQGQTRPGLNGSILRRIRLPIPSIAEQVEIIAEVQRRLSVAEEIALGLDSSRRRAERLRQAVIRGLFGQIPKPDSLQMDGQ